jgi:hypothetical protein
MDDEIKNYDYPLNVSADAGGLARGWLALSVGSLVIAGLFSAFVVLSRTPFIEDIFPLIDLFHMALVLHVNFSILIFYSFFACIFFSIYMGEGASRKAEKIENSGRAAPWRFGAGRVAMGFAAAGAAVMALSPFFGAPKPLMNNYIPVLDNPAFIYGLLIFLTGFASTAAIALSSHSPIVKNLDGQAVMRAGIALAAFVVLAASISFAWSYLTIPVAVRDAKYYEILFWGGGHLLQFNHTILMALAWLCLGGALGAATIKPRFAAFILGLYLIPVTGLFILASGVIFPADTAQYRHYVTLVMEYGMGLPPFVIGVPILLGAVKIPVTSETRHLRASLVVSMLLFGLGGALGYLIGGINLIIPAHYHGVTSGVTMGFIGVAYYLLPRMGFGEPGRIAGIQPYFYGAGQALYIIGMATAGFQNVQRKVAGAQQALHTTGKIISMSIMGLGGMISVVGGVLFLVITIRAMFFSDRPFFTKS